MIMGAVILLVPASADAGTTSLCKGFSHCVKKGHTHAGYKSEQDQSHWSMAPGTNCTNYVAYRLTHGRTTARPPGTNSAHTWADAARKAGVKVVRWSPRKGDVAWWDSGRGGSGRLGHVGYVEKVLSNGTVLISEDNFNKTFGWRKIARKSPEYPTRFIRYPSSDGSPSGAMTDATWDGKALRVSGSASEPDVPLLPVGYEVTVGAPRGEDPVTSFTFATEFFRFTWGRTVRVRGEQRVYLYGMNTLGTKGKDTLLGSRVVDFG